MNNRTLVGIARIWSRVVQAVHSGNLDHARLKIVRQDLLDAYHMLYGVSLVIGPDDEYWELIGHLVDMTLCARWDVSRMLYETS